jgi:predicted GH43/DUF377 family glycosyl hydrolase
MRLTRHPQNPILGKNPDNPWEAGSVLNPTVWREPDGRFGMLYRATNDVNSAEAGHYISSIGLAWSKDGVTWSRHAKPFIQPTEQYENLLGCEDPRVTRISSENYIFYSAVSGITIGDQKQDLVRIALATTKDFQSVKKFGVVGPDVYSKAGALFPQRIHDHYLMLWADQQRAGRSRIILSEFETLDHLKHTHSHDWMPNKIDQDYLEIPASGIYTEQEVGAIPIETADGWLLIYSGFSTEPHCWTICAALLDRHNPRKILGYSHEPLLAPETPGETTGVVNNVCFPEGAVVAGDELYVYYGSGDQSICLATCNLADLLAELKS